MEAEISTLVINDSNNDDDRWSALVGFQQSLNYKMDTKEDILFLTKPLVYEWWSLITCPDHTSGLCKWRQHPSFCSRDVGEPADSGLTPLQIKLQFQNASLTKIKSWGFKCHESENFITCKTLGKDLSRSFIYRWVIWGQKGEIICPSSYSCRVKTPNFWTCMTMCLASIQCCPPRIWPINCLGPVLQLKAVYALFRAHPSRQFDSHPSLPLNCCTALWIIAERQSHSCFLICSWILSSERTMLPPMQKSLLCPFPHSF